MKKKSIIIWLFALLLLTGMTGCTANQNVKTTSSVPLTSYMKPVAESRQITQKTPLKLPASVAILFIPGQQSQNAPRSTTLYQASQQLKEQLLKQTKYVSSVTIIQADDAAQKISLDEIATSYSTDIVIILSYQQDQRTDQTGVAALFDLTVVGAFLIPGVEAKTLTLVDARVIHLPNAALIFRTTAMDERSKYSTTYGVAGSLHEESVNGLLAATGQVGTKLADTLVKFEKYDVSKAVPITFAASNRAAEGESANDYWKKVEEYKTTGGGALGLIPLFMVLGLYSMTRKRK